MASTTPAADRNDENERTNAIGLFNTARSYWHSAEHLNVANVKVTHPQAPITFLFCHAIELYLKAYLRGAGRTVGDLKKVGHRVARLAEQATTSGLALGPEQSEILSHIDEADVAIEARYIVTGFTTRPANDALADVAEHLDHAVCGALGEWGLPVRAEDLVRPEPVLSDGLNDDASQILVQLFNADEIEDRGVRHMARLLGIDLGMLKYHLDQLKEVGFARLGSSSDEDTYWAITPEGRRHVVAHKLTRRVT